MKVEFFTSETSTATFSTRTKPLAIALNSYGMYINIVTPINWKFIKGKLRNIFSANLTYPIKKCVETFIKPPDVAIIGKTSNLQAYLLTKALKYRSTKTIFDLNDAIFLPISSFLRVKVRPGSFYLEKILKEADYVTVNGHYLLNYVRKYNKNASIIHDPIDTELFNPKFKKYNCDKLTITWEGNAKVNFENLTMLFKPLKMIAKEHGKKIKFKIVSYLGDQRVKELFHPLEKFMEIDYGSEQWLPMEEFAKLIYDSDIMVAPLQNTQWYEGKSALRVGIGMALGIPVIASPIGEQKYVIQHGINGFFATNDDEWYKYLKILIEDEELRRKFGHKGREVAEKELSLEVNGRKLYGVIRDVI